MTRFQNLIAMFVFSFFLPLFALVSTQSFASTQANEKLLEAHCTVREIPRGDLSKTLSHSIEVVELPDREAPLVSAKLLKKLKYSAQWSLGSSERQGNPEETRVKTRNISISLIDLGSGAEVSTTVSAERAAKLGLPSQIFLYKRKNKDAFALICSFK